MKLISEIINANLYLTSVIAFFLGSLSEYIWVRWHKNVGNERGHRAGLNVVWMAAISSISVSFIYADALIPLFISWIGRYVGTRVGMWK